MQTLLDMHSLDDQNSLSLWGLGRENETSTTRKQESRHLALG